MLDLTREKDAHVDQRLRNEIMIWLASTRPDGRPHLVAVWFLWDGSNILIFSQPNTQKLRNIRHNPVVMLALDTAEQGDDIVRIEGRAELVDDPDLKATLPAFARKYAARLQAMGWTAEQMAASYSQAIRITPTRFSNWS
jgi:PPOX class probable F420-dependent enzyme